MAGIIFRCFFDVHNVVGELAVADEALLDGGDRGLAEGGKGVVDGSREDFGACVGEGKGRVLAGVRAVPEWSLGSSPLGKKIMWLELN